MSKLCATLFIYTMFVLPAQAAYYAHQFSDKFMTGFVYEENSLISKLMSPVGRSQINLKIAKLEVDGFLIETKNFDKALSVSFKNSFSNIYDLRPEIKFVVPILATRIEAYDRIDSTFCTTKQMKSMSVVDRYEICYDGPRSESKKAAFESTLWDFNTEKIDYTIDGAWAAIDAILKTEWPNLIPMDAILKTHGLDSEYQLGTNLIRGGKHFQDFLASAILHKNGFEPDLASATGWSKKMSTKRSQDVEDDEKEIFRMLRTLKSKKQSLVMPISRCTIKGNLISSPLLVSEANSKDLKCPVDSDKSNPDFFEIEEIKNAGNRLGL